MTSTRQHKMAILTWIVVYPLITGLLALLNPILGEVPMPIQTLLLTGIMVPTMIYLIMPFATAKLHKWLDRDETVTPHSLGEAK